jgi:ABC-type nitrate/sulfonate/bicarbonate transport system substrate-binding protein
MATHRWLAPLLVVSTVLALAGCGGARAGGEATSDPKAPIALGRFVGPFVLQAGMSMKAFDDINLKGTDIDSGAAALPLIARGALSGADGISEPPLVTAWERQLDLKIVWATNLSPHALLARKGIDGPEDLRGKKVAAPGGSTLQIELAQYLTKHGMTTKDIDFVDLDAASIVSSYQTGAIDAAYLWQPQASTLKAKGAHALANSVGTSFDIFSKKFIEENPSAVQAFVCDMARVQTKFRSDPKPVWKAMSKELDLDAATVPKLLPKDAVYDPAKMTTDVLGPDGEVVHRMVSAGKAMVTLHQAEKAPAAADVGKMIDTRFAKAVASGKCSS